MAIMHREIFFPFLWKNKYKYLELLGKTNSLIYKGLIIYLFIFNKKYIFFIHSIASMKYLSIHGNSQFTRNKL
jgi:hypothetical protein